MQQDVRYALVGLFVIVLGSAWIAISLWLAYGDFDKDYRRYHVYMNESVSGLYIDAPVKYRGVDVGKVRKMEINPWDTDQVLVSLDIESEVVIRSDTIATLSVQGLTGIAYIELTGGSSGDPLKMDEGSEDIPIIKSGQSLFVRMDAAISELIANVNSFTSRADDFLNDDTRDSVQRTLDNISEVSAMLADQRDRLESSLQNASEFFATSNDVAKRLPELMDRLQASAKSVNAMADSLATAGGNVDMTIREASRHITTAGRQTLPEIDTLIGEVRQLTISLERVAARISEDPRLFLYGNELEAPGPGE